MVDLVKIRKKAKERLETQVSGVGSQVSGEPGVETKGVSIQLPVEAPKSDASKRRGSKKTSAPSEAAPAEAKPGPDTQPPTPDPRVDPRPPTPDTPAKSTKLDRFKEQAGKRREAADSHGRVATESTVADERLEVLTFAIAGENYAIDIERIVEIVPPRAATRVPNAAQSIVGIISLRGTIVTLIDVRRRLKHAPSESTPESRIIVVEHEGETVGFEVDRVFRVVKIAAADVDPHPVVHTSEQDESIRGVFRHGQSLTILLDFAKLLGGRESQPAGSREALAAGR